ncbi:sigma-70 family RNA polymerase sigma factor [Sphingomonas sp. CFBP 8760]|nr:sigma-70 family RNA polymerase sigma factor [Sphingomonas sp. CFBP 8760]MBD8548313.1 sigma-70 family RNA polymerase sigma factor [Sphingomonas sp. CFBP 8760]
MLVRVGAEDHAAFQELYRLTAAKLFGITLRICGNREAAEDVLHEGYFVVWRRAGAWEPRGSSPITWLAMIARNRAIDWQRAQDRRRADPLEDASDIAELAPNAEARLLAAIEHQTLLDCISELSTQSQSAILSAFYDGLTYVEVADRAGVPLGTAKSWVRRGLQQLKTCMEIRSATMRSQP